MKEEIFSLRDMVRRLNTELYSIQLKSPNLNKQTKVLTILFLLKMN